MRFDNHGKAAVRKRGRGRHTVARLHVGTVDCRRRLGAPCARGNRVGQVGNALLRRNEVDTEVVRIVKRNLVGRNPLEKRLPEPVHGGRRGRLNQDLLIAEGNAAVRRGHHTDRGVKFARSIGPCVAAVGKQDFAVGQDIRLQVGAGQRMRNARRRGLARRRGGGRFRRLPRPALAVIRAVIDVAVIGGQKQRPVRPFCKARIPRCRKIRRFGGVCPSERFGSGAEAQQDAQQCGKKQSYSVFHRLLLLYAQNRQNSDSANAQFSTIIIVVLQR